MAETSVSMTVDRDDLLAMAPRSEFLAEVLAALKKRRRAIKYTLRELTAEKIVERGEGQDREKLEIGCEFRSSQHTALRLFLWGDRWIWVDARSLKKGDGWTWHFTHEGRAVGGLTGRQIVEALEASIAASSPVHNNHTELLEQVWRPILALGPRAAT